MTTISEVAELAGKPSLGDEPHGSPIPGDAFCFKERLLEIAHDRGALRYGDFTLSSGAHSNYYFDGRLLTLDPEGAFTVGNALLPLMRKAGVSAVGGPTLGADPPPPS